MTSCYEVKHPRLVDLLGRAKDVVAADCGGLGVEHPQDGQQLRFPGA